MLGNDVVDLDDAESRGPRHARFDARVFAVSERALMAASPYADQLRSVLWAAKESAYKALRKRHRVAVFSPSRFVVRPDGHARAVVDADGRTFYVDLVTADSWVHAVAREAEDDGGVCSAVATLPPHGRESEAVRRLAVETIARTFGLASADLEIRRDGRIPLLWWRGRPSGADLSLSHHGRFGAFACVPAGSWRAG